MGGGRRGGGRPLNLAVSFYLAFRLALRAQAINDASRHRIAAAIRHRLRHAPLSFLLPPRPGDEPPADHRVDDLNVDSGDGDAARG